jgi:ComF family protein
LCAKTNAVDQLLIVADYKNLLVEKSLKFLKYKFIRDLERPLLILIKKYLKWLTLDKKFNVFQVNPLLISVPLHPRRLNWRGFNQSELFAKNLADTFQMETASDVIERMVNTVPQADIKEREERLKNLNGIFGIFNKEKITGREVLLIDDICTTGATLNECAKVLKANGATKVTSLVVARG